jgi:hypothetical protein
VFLAGIPVADPLVLELARQLRDAGFDNTAERIESARDRDARIVALEITDRNNLLEVLVDCPDGLGELRATLLKEKVWREREGIG